MKELELDAERETQRICEFIKRELASSGLNDIAIGVSGGVDSALVAALCVRTIGQDRVHPLIMPYRTSSPESIEHAMLLAQKFALKPETIEITPAVDKLKEMLEVVDTRRLGNIMARTRMIILYDRSARHNAIVAGTGNRTEALLGYTTLHGDSACGFAPIAHLYKTQVRQLAAHLGVPKEIIEKSPTADLWTGQTDEGELGFTYAEADSLLFEKFNNKKSDAELEAMGFAHIFIARVNNMIARSDFKRRMPNSLQAE